MDTSSSNSESLNSGADDEAAKKAEREFKRQAFLLSQEYTLDEDQVYKAYNGKRDSLAAHFNAMNGANLGKTVWTGVGALSMVVTLRNWRMGLPLVAVAAAAWGFNHYKSCKIGNAISNELKQDNRRKNFG